MAWAIGMGLMKTFLANYSRTMFYQISFVAQTTLKLLGVHKLIIPLPFSFIHIKSSSVPDRCNQIICQGP